MASLLYFRNATGKWPALPSQIVVRLVMWNSTCNSRKQSSFQIFGQKDVRFDEFHKTLDSVCSDLHSKGIGANVKSAVTISYEDEDVLWKEGVLGYNSPRTLLNTVFFYVGLFFSLRGGQEQRDLSWQNFKRVPADVEVYDSESYYECVEFVSKNNQHRFRDIHVKNKTVKAYANCSSDKCLVRIVNFFRSKTPSDPKAFYLRPLEKIPSDPESKISPLWLSCSVSMHFIAWSVAFMFYSSIQ